VSFVHVAPFKTGVAVFLPSSSRTTSRHSLKPRPLWTRLQGWYVATLLYWMRESVHPFALCTLLHANQKRYQNGVIFAPAAFCFVRGSNQSDASLRTQCSVLFEVGSFVPFATSCIVDSPLTVRFDHLGLNNCVPSPL
jgi:hypothetical protein